MRPGSESTSTSSTAGPHVSPFGDVKPEVTDIREKSVTPKGEPLTLDRRLFMQLQVFAGLRCQRELDEVIEAVRASRLESVVYLDANNPYGIGVLLITENPDDFVGSGRELMTSNAFDHLEHHPEFTMIGRTYATGREPDLEYWLLKKPRTNTLNPAWPWAVWYPLRRKGEFSVLPTDEQRAMLKEHAGIGYLYGEADLAHDVRLACHGLDCADNDFVIGLIGKTLYPLSRCVQEMRRTQQTSRYMEKMGPFFVGKAVWQSPVF